MIMRRPHPHPRTAKTVSVAVLSVLMSSAAGWTTAAAPPGSATASDALQPTQGEVSADERAAGIHSSPAQQGTEQRELNQIYRNLMGQQPSPPAQPGPPK